MQCHKQVAYNAIGEIEPDSLNVDSQTLLMSQYRNLNKEILKRQSFSKDIVDLVLETNTEAMRALTDLDIEPQDCMSLSDTLDPDKSGEIEVIELIQGVSRLRGPSRRSDIVAVDLMTRSMQARIDDLWLHYKLQQRNSSSQQQDADFLSV